MTPTEALATAVDAWWDVVVDYLPHGTTLDSSEASRFILAALPPGWRLVGPDEVTVTEALREVWESVPATYDDDDPMVRRHARAINAIPAILAALSADKEEQK